MVRAGELRERIAVYARREVEADTRETDFAYSELRRIWAKIVPASGRAASIDGEMERAEITHKVYIRTASLPELCPDMYFLHRGQQYDVQYYMPVYNQRGFTEIGCRLIIEMGGMTDGA